jgi:hypothetical protein
MSGSSPATDGPLAGSAQAQQPSAARRLMVIGLVALGLLGVSGKTFWSYRSAYLRPTPKMPACVLVARRKLRQEELISGTEPHETPSGETVYLTPNQDSAVRCAKMVDVDFGRRLTGALIEVEPEKRALELLKLVRDVPADPAFDRQAMTAFHMSSAGIGSLPQQLPEVKAASDEVDLLHACRFNTRMKCPTRPPIPWLVWASGAPGAAGALYVLGVVSVSGVRRLRARMASKKKAPAPST